MAKWMAAGLVLIALVSGALIYKFVGSGQSLAQTEVDWRLLGQMDYITGVSGGELKALDGQLVQIPGFMVPLEDNQKLVAEFLLVPTPQACIHVPAPPPNQMVYVKMKNPGEAAFGPIWVHGTLRIVTKKSMYGDASFELIGETIEPYR